MKRSHSTTAEAVYRGHPEVLQLQNISRIPMLCHAWSFRCRDVQFDSINKDTKFIVTDKTMENDGKRIFCKLQTFKTWTLLQPDTTYLCSIPTSATYYSLLNLQLLVCFSCHVIRLCNGTKQKSSHNFEWRELLPFRLSWQMLAVSDCAA